MKVLISLATPNKNLVPSFDGFGPLTCVSGFKTSKKKKKTTIYLVSGFNGTQHKAEKIEIKTLLFSVFLLYI